MKENSVISLGEYKFNSLDQYLRSIETELRAAQGLEPDQKLKKVRKCVGEFFKKIRVYRNLHLDEVAKNTSINAEDLSSFEAGSESLDKDSELKLAQYYRAETHYFSLYQKSMDIKNKFLPTDKREIGISLFKQFGSLPDGMSLKDLEVHDYGKILDFRSDKTPNI